MMDLGECLELSTSRVIGSMSIRMNSLRGQRTAYNTPLKGMSSCAQVVYKLRIHILVSTSIALLSIPQLLLYNKR